MNILYTAWSKDQLRGIYDFYKGIGSPKKGRKIRVSIHKKVHHLKDFPLLGREEEMLSSLGQGHRYVVRVNTKSYIESLKKPFTSLIFLTPVETLRL